MKSQIKIRLAIFAAVVFITILTGQVMALEAPTNPVSSPEPNGCGSDRTINISWDAPDAGTTGIEGYSVFWDEQSQTIPSENVIVTQPQTITCLGNGTSHYVHIRAKDEDGNWSETLHVGPFCIEDKEYEIPGDINDDEALNLTDAMLGLKLTAAMELSNETIHLNADVNKDEVIGLAEVIYILKRISGLIFLPGDCLRPEEAKLGSLINEYRQENDLDPLLFSKSLTQTAQQHLIDLHENEPEEGCSQHSWSDQGDWTSVCDTGALETWNLMQIKPCEITYGIYPAEGYEVAYDNKEEQATAEVAIKYLTESDDHKTVILQQGNWSQLPSWAVMGVGLYEHHAVIWFGTEADPQGTIEPCQ
ncbi:hypothetical protein QUF72_12680 [Desulfobacterales bacterium HSG2]|nr:hypothetical protein [Desulfobacterales bacterium HSG2]